MAGLPWLQWGSMGFSRELLTGQRRVNGHKPPYRWAA
jgi:hypothetical protein